VWRRLLENSLSAKVSCWLIRLLILGSGYNTMISHLGLIRTFPSSPARLVRAFFCHKKARRIHTGRIQIIIEYLFSFLNSIHVDYG
ncbi:hypothetical protein, partial [Enterobacter asburiae]|uniref:hypothetical protein n=1 Tax=Enterobacter asburiae TaxID=61645 RepID=UPI00197EAC9E